ncbi:tetratricopeptide repeat protein [Mycobacterium sp. CBMA293]|uniref:tetratricopeptide repeat protein n=1 Tax=unclassified Mycolicibacterium TaxID=2636767 RepID=UPI0013265DE0|nr:MULTISPECIES: tetratricopeptide repeat protein [unclassified Mycolicibacterium]MUL49022.1 tetratricopeptide repeat protein [Mycolicibacterium sp. CBMA 360]MUL95906.1 tetratricopeptide repeat protein [Mycolicibacterium sp. CBMA 230]MUM35432.1 tetratricopeptide repeat protein [Mycolicibacterium sp. CBMA 361]MUL60965.1 tetratricopeptide repeat protein [Mycolicibacterium sp. CBMA 335]MUL71978.1 tetratricopeptide repeat protein [Mycolicibacterium sp. CBMA 311]
MTRPRPVGPALAGAVDLSALKNRPAEGAAAAGGAPGGIEITEANLEAEVLIRSGEVPVVVLLWSPRSDSSVQLGQALSALAAEDGGTWSFGTVNVDTSPRIAQMFGIQGVPTVVALVGGQPVTSFEGGQPAEQLRRWVDMLLRETAGGGAEGEAEQVDPALAQAREFLDTGDFDGALAAYQAILDADPAHVEAKGAVQQIAFLQRASAQRPEAVRLADATPDDIDLAFAAADVQLFQRDVDGAFNRLIALIKKTSGDDRTRVRTRLIELFDLFDPADPEVIAGRRNLANALY